MIDKLSPFFLCFRLEQAKSGKWKLAYLLQDSGDPSLLIPAAHAWKSRRCKASLLKRKNFDARKFLRAELVRAATICDAIAKSLENSEPEDCAIDSSNIRLFLCKTAQALRDKGFCVLPAWSEGKEECDLPVPSGICGTLRPYQVRGYSWLALLQQLGIGACLADDMGLGKSVQALALIQRLREQGERRPALLICPTSVTGHWLKESARFTPDLEVMLHHGSRRYKGVVFQQKTAHCAIVLSSYSLLRRDLPLLKEVPWAGLILDEAQNIKNHRTAQASAACELAAGYRIALTGTPIENNVGELWSIMEFLNPGVLGNFAEFTCKFFDPIQYRRDDRAMEELKNITSPFILRRVKSDPGVIRDLPEKMEIKVYCSLSQEQEKLYRETTGESIRGLKGVEGIRRKGLIFSVLTKLKQICNHPAQFLKEKGKGKLIGRSGKLDRLTEMLDEVLATGKCALVFTQYVEMGKIIECHIQRHFQCEVLFLHGQIVREQREHMVERFQKQNGPPIFILSLRAGGTGLNLTRATCVFHYDRWWNPAVEDQASDRAFRIGQTKDVQVYKFICARTLEEKIDEIIEDKQCVRSRVIGENRWSELSNRELEDLIFLH